MKAPVTRAELNWLSPDHVNFSSDSLMRVKEIACLFNTSALFKSLTDQQKDTLVDIHDHFWPRASNNTWGNFRAGFYVAYMVYMGAWPTGNVPEDVLGTRSARDFELAYRYFEDRGVRAPLKVVSSPAPEAKPKIAPKPATSGFETVIEFTTPHWVEIGNRVNWMLSEDRGKFVGIRFTDNGYEVCVKQPKKG